MIGMAIVSYISAVGVSGRLRELAILRLKATEGAPVPF